jgi:hypothetical protein
VPVLLLAGTFEPFDAQQARECGSDGHVTKPFDSRLLIERVEQLLAQGRARTAGLSAPRAVDRDLEAMFDDLAQPDRPEMVDAPPAPASARDVPVPTTADAATWVDDEPDDAPTGLPVEIDGDVPADAASLPALRPEDIDAIARAVVARLSERVLREIAWDVVPDLAEIIVRERIRELERDERESS